MTEHDVRIYLWSFRAGSKNKVLSWASIISFSRSLFPCISVLVVLLATPHTCAYVCGCGLSASCDSVRYGHLIDCFFLISVTFEGQSRLIIACSWHVKRTSYGPLVSIGFEFVCLITTCGRRCCLVSPQSYFAWLLHQQCVTSPIQN